MIQIYISNLFFTPFSAYIDFLVVVQVWSLVLPKFSSTNKIDEDEEARVHIDNKET